MTHVHECVSPLPPIDKLPGYVSDDPDAMMHYELGAMLRRTVGSYVLSRNFDVCGVRTALTDALEREGPGLPRRTLAREADWRSYEPFTDHCRRLGLIAADGYGADLDITLSPATITEARNQLATLPYGFEELAEYRSMWGQKHSLGLLRTVNRLSNEENTQPNWADEAYRLIADACKRPNDYTLPLERPESLMLLCYVPDAARQLLRRMMRHNLTLGLMERDLTSLPADDADWQLLGAVRRYFTADVLSGDQWDKRSLSEANSVCAALAATSQLSSLAEIQAITSAGKGRAAVEAYETGGCGNSSRFSDCR